MEKSEFYREARSDLTGPLAGVRVLEATTSWAGPMCACILADLGADVIKVEDPVGEVGRLIQPFLPGTAPPLSFLHATVNRNKRSLTLDLRKPEGGDIFLQLARRSDIVVENFRPGTLDKWGVGYHAVRAVKPDIVYVSVSGYGQFGPNSNRVGYDQLAQAAGGFISLNGEADGHPVKAPTFLCDDLSGLHGAIGALAALRHRDQTGEGQHVDAALLDAMLFQSNGYLTQGALGLGPKRMGNEVAFAVPANVYSCRDGQVYLGVLLDTHWKVLARIVGRSELAEHPEYAKREARVANRNRINQLMRDWLADRRVEDVLEVMAEAAVPAAPVHTYAQAARDPHVLARDMLQQARSADGSTQPITGPATKFSRTPTKVRTAAPGLGAHNDEVLDELGIDRTARERLRDAKVI
jgi:formyl-CoA transferase